MKLPGSDLLKNLCICIRVASISEVSKLKLQNNGMSRGHGSIPIFFIEFCILSIRIAITSDAN